MADGVFVLRPDGLPAITCTLGENTGSYRVTLSKIDLHEDERAKIAYAEGARGGFVRRSRFGLAQLDFEVTVFGSDQQTAQQNKDTLERAILNKEGGWLEYRPRGLPDSVIHTYYRYHQSPSPTFRLGALSSAAPAVTGPGLAVTSEGIVLQCRLMTDALGWSDPWNDVTLVASTNIDNEGTSVIVDSGNIKGLGTQGILELEGAMGPTDDVLKQILAYKRRMRTTDNTDLEWNEAEDMTPEGTGTFLYGRFIGIYWQPTAGQSNYPVDILDNSFDAATLIGLGKIQSDGDDFRVYVDGVEDVNRWLQDFNSATAQCWVNFDFAANVPMTLNGAIDSDDTSVVVNEAISSLGATGVLKIGSEYLHYSSKNDGTKTFTIDTRGYGNSTPASHSNGATTMWIQFDVWIYYGNTGLSAPATDDDYKPAFELASTNTLWVYLDFGENDGLRSAAWTKNIGANPPTWYTANHGGNADPWQEIGAEAIWYSGGVPLGDWYLDNRCLFQSASFANGEAWTDYPISWSSLMGVRSYDGGYYQEYSVPAPALPSTWTAWSYSGGVTATSYRIMLQYRHNGVGVGTTDRLECANVTLNLNSSNTPVITVGGELSGAWSQQSDAGVSGNIYMRLSTYDLPSYLRFSATNIFGMDLTYKGKVVPVVIARCSPGVTVTLQWKTSLWDSSYVLQQSDPVTLTGTSYWQILYQFGEIDLPPFQVPDWVTDAGLGTHIYFTYLDLYATLVSGSGYVDIDVVCLCKADEWISRVYNARTSHGLQETTDQSLRIDGVSSLIHYVAPSNQPLVHWDRQGVPFTELFFENGLDHRVRVFGWKDSTGEIDQDYDMNLIVKGRHATISPFSE